MSFTPDKESMFDLIRDAREKKNYKQLLIIAQGFGDDFQSLTTEQLAGLQWTWQATIKKLFSEEDAAYLINNGSILCLIKENKLDDFLNSIKGIQCYSSNKKDGLQCDFIILTEEEMNFIERL